MSILRFLRPTREAVERLIRDHRLRADELAREGDYTRANMERQKADRLEKRALPKAR